MMNYVVVVVISVFSLNAADFHVDEFKTYPSEESISRTATPISDDGGEAVGLPDQTSPNRVGFRRSPNVIDLAKLRNGPSEDGESDAVPPLLAPQPQHPALEDLEIDITKKPHGFLRLFGRRYRTNEPRKSGDEPQQNGLSQLHSPIRE